MNEKGDLTHADSIVHISNKAAQEISVLEDIQAITSTSMKLSSKLNETLLQEIIRNLKFWQSALIMVGECKDEKAIEALDIAKNNAFATLHQIYAGAADHLIAAVVELEKDYLRTPTVSAHKLSFLEKIKMLFRNS